MRILVVDDDRDSAWSTSQLLCVAGYDSRFVCDGESCLAECKTFSPDVIILDLRMPGKDGFQIAEAMRADGFAGRIIGLTGLVGEGGPVVPPQFDDVLLKPAKLESLRQAIEGQ